MDEPSLHSTAEEEGLVPEQMAALTSPVERSVPSCRFKKQFRQSELCRSQTPNDCFHLVFQMEK